MPNEFCGTDFRQREIAIQLIPEDFDRGRQSAELDFLNGRRKFYAQTRGAWGKFLFELMRDRYGIFVEHVSDMTDEKKLSYECGYNSVAREYIEDLDGAAAMDRIHVEVKAFRAAYYRRLA